MKAVIRVDSSALIGTGHLVRCRTLAEALRNHGGEVVFVCRNHKGHLIEALTTSRFPVIVMPASQKTATGVEYTPWLGVTEVEDAVDTIAALAGNRPDWLIVDHYGLGAKWQQSLRPHCQRIMVIDDLCNRPHDCDVLLDQNYAGTREARYQTLVPENCNLFVGPHYALLHPEYARIRATKSPPNGTIRRILIYFGGVDAENLTGLSLEALAAPAFEHLEIDVVLGGANPNAGAVEKLAAMRPRTRIHRMRPHLADLMAAADLAIGAGGATTWERLCLGLPSLVTALAENQIISCKALAADGLIWFAGQVGEVDAIRIQRLVSKMIATPRELASQAVRGANLVDGLGVARVAKLLHGAR